MGAASPPCPCSYGEEESIKIKSHYISNRGKEEKTRNKIKKKRTEASCGTDPPRLSCPSLSTSVPLLSLIFASVPSFFLYNSHFPTTTTSNLSYCLRRINGIRSSQFTHRTAQLQLIRQNIRRSSTWTRTIYPSSIARSLSPAHDHNRPAKSSQLSHSNLDRLYFSRHFRF